MYIPEHEILSALRKSYPLPEWCFIEKLPDAAGFDAVRTADAFAVNTFKGRGLETVGFEVKASRADWLKEVKDPAKSESHFIYCNRWWLVITSEDFVKAGELPETWGMMIAERKKPDAPITFRVIKKAPKQKRHAPDWEKVAVMLRKAMTQTGIDEKERQAIASEASEGTRKFMKLRHEQELERLRLEHVEEMKTVREFEAASGIKLGTRWQNGRIAEAVKAIMQGEGHKPMDALRHLVRAAENIAAGVRAEIAQIERVQVEQATKDQAIADGLEPNAHFPPIEDLPPGAIAWREAPNE